MEIARRRCALGYARLREVSGRGMCGSWKSATGDNDRNGVFVFHFVVHLTPNDAS